MMNWCKLVDYQNDYITRGAVFRIPAQWPYEKVVDLLFYNPLEKDSGMGFLVASGYKRGLIKQHLPKESEVDGKRDCVATSWLIGVDCRKVRNRTLRDFRPIVFSCE